MEAIMQGWLSIWLYGMAGIGISLSWLVYKRHNFFCFFSDSSHFFQEAFSYLL